MCHVLCSTVACYLKMNPRTSHGESGDGEIHTQVCKQRRIGIPNDELPFLGSCYDFYLITFIQRPSMGSLLLRSKHY